MWFDLLGLSSDNRRVQIITASVCFAIIGHDLRNDLQKRRDDLWKMARQCKTGRDS